MPDKSSSSGGGIGFLGLLAILFIALKLTHYIDWSWWWVLCPLWITPACVLIFLVGGLLVALLGLVGVALVAFFTDSTYRRHAGRLERPVTIRDRKLDLARVKRLNHVRDNFPPVRTEADQVGDEEEV